MVFFVCRVGWSDRHLLRRAQTFFIGSILHLTLPLRVFFFLIHREKKRVSVSEHDPSPRSAVVVRSFFERRDGEESPDHSGQDKNKVQADPIIAHEVYYGIWSFFPIANPGSFFSHSPRFLALSLACPLSTFGSQVITPTPSSA